MKSGTRMPSWKERENNKRRERRRRAIAAKIFAGLRTYGNYRLPKHCDNNEVLRALCDEAGWAVEPDGTTYRKGCKPLEHMDIAGGSATVTPSSSYHPSPCTSFNPSPASSSFPSPTSTSYAAAAAANLANGNSLIPWLKSLSSVSSSATSSKLPQLYFHGNSISAPVTPPFTSPSAQSPRSKMDWTSQTARMGWGSSSYSFLPSSTPTSPGHQTQPDSEWLSGGPTSPTFSLVAHNPFTLKGNVAGGSSGSRMWTPGQSGTCSPAIPASFDQNADIPMAQVIHDEFAFGSNKASGMVKAWEGERIHEDSGSDDLELSLGTTRAR
uniref:Protein BZR1 homolog n=1 Tax=Kalanchoe fedtschenkoi TaxID=63787 RepID=A0A7N0SY43_KALFE